MIAKHIFRFYRSLIKQDSRHYNVVKNHSRELIWFPVFMFGLMLVFHLVLTMQLTSVLVMAFFIFVIANAMMVQDIKREVRINEMRQPGPMKTRPNQRV